jgi:Domain of unknown function (DUF4932)
MFWLVTLLVQGLGLAYAQSASPVTLDTNEALFTVLSAINACGYDAELSIADPVRMTVRGELAHNIEGSEPAKAATAAVCSFYHDHQQRTDTLTLSEYISFALYLNQPPALSLKGIEADVPPDASEVLGLLPLLESFYREVGVNDLWQRHLEAYAQLTDRYRDALSKMILDTEFYLKLPGNSYRGRTFTIYIEAMGAASETNARNYGLQYYVVITPGKNIALKMDQIRHAYLHYLLDPMVGNFADDLAALSPLMESLRPAPMDDAFKQDPTLLVTECVIRAVEARTLAGRKATREEQEQAVNLSMSQGFVLTRYFYEKLIAYEKDNVGFKNALPLMISGIDVRKQIKQTAQIEFARESDPEVLHVERAQKGKLLIRAQERLSAGDPLTAERLARQALAEKTEDPGRALFILAQISLNRNIDGARDYFEKALRATSEPKVVAWSHIYLGRIFDLEDDRQGGALRAQALAHYKAAAAASASLPEAQAAAEEGLEKPYEPPDSAKQPAPQSSNDEQN